MPLDEIYIAQEIDRIVPCITEDERDRLVGLFARLLAERDAPSVVRAIDDQLPNSRSQALKRLLSKAESAPSVGTLHWMIVQLAKIKDLNRRLDVDEREPNHDE